MTQMSQMEVRRSSWRMTRRQKKTGCSMFWRKAWMRGLGGLQMTRWAHRFRLLLFSHHQLLLLLLFLILLLIPSKEHLVTRRSPLGPTKPLATSTWFGWLTNGRFKKAKTYAPGTVAQPGVESMKRARTTIQLFAVNQATLSQWYRKQIAMEERTTLMAGVVPLQAPTEAEESLLPAKGIQGPQPVPSTSSIFRNLQPLQTREKEASAGPLETPPLLHHPPALPHRMLLPLSSPRPKPRPTPPMFRSPHPGEDKNSSSQGVGDL
ncbi:hypothetical protein GOODEAATRI_004155 [Goodea atripinnis]|uniref:Uncharacterized protein n=1 Tax=Goodea atripinnis TaxID=208336 RepID=A0ABV0MP90_9TELE